jgi:hypothetical protein
MPRQRQPVRAFDVDIEAGGGRAAGVDRQRHRGSLFSGELHGGGRITGHFDRARRLHADAVIAGRALDIVEVETDGALVAIEQEARQCRRQHHGIAYRDVDGRATEPGRIPRHRHDAGGTGELGNVEADFGSTVSSDRDNS